MARPSKRVSARGMAPERISVGKRRTVVTREDVLLAATSPDEGINGAKALISWDRLGVICELLEK